MFPAKGTKSSKDIGRTTLWRYKNNLSVSLSNRQLQLFWYCLGHKTGKNHCLDAVEQQSLQQFDLAPMLSKPIFFYVSALSFFYLCGHSLLAQSNTSFIGVNPCRVVDTRDPNFQAFGPPFMAANSSRTFIIPASSCGVPQAVSAYSFNITVVPRGPLPYITIWPTGKPQPLVSTLNSYNGNVTANAAIVSAGERGAVSVYVAGDTDLIIDLNGYFFKDPAKFDSTSTTVTTNSNQQIITPLASSTSTNSPDTATNYNAIFATATMQVTGSSTARLVTDKLSDHINVKDFGAQCNGTFDDSSAFQAAHDSATYGLTIEIPPGVCVISRNINVYKDNIKFRGAGQAATYITATAGVTKLFNVTNGTSNQVVMPEFSDMSVDLAKASSGTAFYFNTVRLANIHRVFTSNAYISYWFDRNHSSSHGSTSIHMSEFQIDNTPDLEGARGILIDGVDDDWFISNGRLFQGSSSHSNVGFEIRSGGGFMVNNVDISSYGTALLVDPPANSFVRYAQIHGLQCDSSWNDAAVLDGSAAFASGYPNGVYNLHFVNSWFSSAGAHGGNGNGLNIVSAQGILIDTSQFYSNSMSGLRLQSGARDITVSNNQFSGNSNGYGNGGANTGKYSGITVDNGTFSFGLLNNRSGLTSVYSNTQKYGISIGSGVHHYRIIGNDLVNNLTGPLSDASSSPNSVVSLNLLN